MMRFYVLKQLKVMAGISLQGMVLNLVLFTSLCATNPFAYSQPLNTPCSVNIKGKSVLEVFLIIENQTPYTFVYFSSGLDLEQRINLQAPDSNLQEVLDKLGQSAGMRFEISDRKIVVTENRAQERLVNESLQPLKSTLRTSRGRFTTGLPRTRRSIQQLEVTGEVKDLVNNEPLPGVSVSVKGTSMGTVTDEQGRYRLGNVPGNGTLVFYFLGFQSREVAVKGRTRIDALMEEDMQSLDEVVVVGYDTQIKTDVTSAVSQVTGDEIRKTPAVALQNGLSGKLPGLFSQQRSGRPGGDNAADVYIRGVSTYTGSQSPLVLVDDVEYNYNQLYLIDPNEVESISILKDAAATSIYGIKGANGVILVTTRRGRSGKPQINLRTQFGIQTPVNVLETLGAYETALLRNEALELDGLEPMFTEEELELFRTGADPYGYPDVNWYDVVFKPNALVTNNNLDISGGSERVRYFITLGYQWQDGLLRDIPYKGPDQVASGQTQANTNFSARRYKFRSNLDIKATNSLSFKLDLSGTRQSATRPGFETGFSTLFRYEYTAPYIMPVYNPDGSFGYANPNRMVPPNENNNIAAVYSLGGHRNALNDFMNVRLSGEQLLETLTPGLSVSGVLAYSYENTTNRQMRRYQTDIPTYWYNPETGVYTPRDPNNYVIGPYQLLYDGGTPNRRLNLQGIVDYKRAFGLHNAGAMVLFNQTSYMDGADPPANFRGYTFRFSYNYNHKYLLEINGAYNGSDRFITQQQYQLFPAFSAGWNLAKEPFFQRAFPFMEGLKIRGSYGWVGSDDIGGNQYLYEEVYERSGSYSFGEFHNNIPNIVEGAQGNNDVTWQTERKADIGLDFSLFEGRLSGSLDYFDNFRYDILTRRSTIPAYFGVQQSNLPPVNIGEVSNRGYEVEATYQNTIGRVGFHMTGNVSFARNKIVFMDEPEPQYPWHKATGLSIGMIQQHTWLGFYESEEDIAGSPVPAGEVKPGYLKYEDRNGDGVIDNDDRAYQGLPNLPNTNIGLTLGFSYRNFSFSVLLQSALNFDVYMGNENAVPFKTNLQPIHLGRWTPETASAATFPALTTTFNGTYMNPDNRSTFWTTRGDYLRIRSADLNYDVPSQLTDKIGLGAVRVFASGFNLYTWSEFLKRFQFDPEIRSGEGGYVYPPERIINFGLNVTFK